MIKNKIGVMVDSFRLDIKEGIKKAKDVLCMNITFFTQGILENWIDKSLNPFNFSSIELLSSLNITT